MTTTTDGAVSGPSVSDGLRGPLVVGEVTDADYRLMIDSITDYAIFFLDPQGIVLTWNPGAERLKGYAADEIIGRPISIFYPSELLEKDWPRHELTQAAQNGRFQDEGWRLRKDGTRFWASIVLTRLTGPDGELRGFSKITRDLSERQKQDELLRASEERFRLMVNGVKDYAIFMLDPSGYIVSWNAGARANKGYEASEILGKHFSVFYPPEVAATGFPDEELRIAREVGRYEDEGWRVRKDGTRFWASVVITALFDATGTHRGFAKVTRDLTERRRVTSLEDEGRRITTFLAMLGHELRNPLAPIANALAIMSHPSVPAETVRRMTDIASRQLRQITRLVDDLLDVGRITSGNIHLEAKPVRLAEVMREGVEAVRPMMDAKRHTLSVDAPATDVWVSGDRARLIQTLCNLLNNAAKFTPHDGHIQIRLEAMEGNAVVSVKDNGPGIPATHLPGIFKLFAQGEQELSRAQGGLGLGLTLVQQLVTLQGGDVSAFSKGVPGEGSEFLIKLPTIAPPLELRQMRGPHDAKRILVVDDNKDAAETLAVLIEGMGYVATLAFDGPSAFEAIKRDQPDAAVLDIGLPGLTGLEVAERVRREIANPPALIAVTGYGQPSDRAKSFEAGFLEHFTKPLDMAKLESSLDRVLKDH